MTPPPRWRAPVARPWFAVFVATFLVGAVLAHAEPTSEFGAVRGTVRAAEGGEPLHYANVVLIGTTIGTMARDGGNFQIQRVPPGRYRVQASFVGYAPRVFEIEVRARQTVLLDFELQPGKTFVTPAFQVFADPVQSVEDTRNLHFSHGEDFFRAPVDEVEDVVGLAAGVVAYQGDLVVHGGRPGEVSRRIDGVPVDDPLSGGSVQLGLLSVAQSELVTSGMDPEYGNANSAVIDYMTRSGGASFGGTLRYMTDDYGRADKTYTNLDRFAVGFGGPTPFDSLRYYLSGETTFQDGDFVSTKNYPQHEMLGIRWTERAARDLRVQGRLDWNRGTVHLSGEMTLSSARRDPYFHNWTTEGYVSRVLQYAEVRPNRFRPGTYVVQGTATLYDGPWRESSTTAPYVPVSREPECTFCLLPISDNQSVRAVRVIDFQGRGSDPENPLYILAGAPLFEGFQTPFSSWAPELEGALGDTSRVYYNSAEHVTTTDNRSMQLKWSLRHALSGKSFYEIKLSRLSFDVLSTVAGKAPEEYDSARKFVWVPGRGPDRVGSIDFYTDESVPFFATAYDRPVYNRRRTVTYLLRTDLTTKRWAGHRIKTGLLVQYNDLESSALTAPGLQRNFMAPYGLGRNTFRTFNPEGSFYVQDRWRHEGMVINGGVRFDFFSPGSGVGVDIHSTNIRTDVQRWQTQWSPRLGLAFPITSRDVFHFHYGRFIQFPPKNFIFASQDVNQAIGTLGNPNLESESSVSYQAGIRHHFTDQLTSQFVLFNKDYFGLVSSVEVTDDSTGTQNFRYVNKAFGSARGLEVTLTRAMSRNVAFNLAYTYSFADGVSSNPDFGRQAAGFAYIPTGELPLDWDQRHTFNATLTVARPGDWSATFLHQYGSGLPWTPVFRFERKQDPSLENSRRFPSSNILSVRGEKYFSIHGHRLRAFFDGRNLLNGRVPLTTNPGIFPGLESATAAYTEYATETGRFGGAYLQDTDGDGQDEFFPVNDPTVFGQRRHFLVGLGLEF